MEEIYKDIVEQLHDGVIVLDNKLKLIYNNNTLKECG